MRSITPDDVARLAKRDHAWTVSIYTPLEFAGGMSRANLLRVKNDLTNARRQLEELGVAKTAIDQALAPLAELTTSTRALPPAPGMAAFAAPGITAEIYGLPASPQALVATGPRFMTTPALTTLDDELDFFVLAISHKDVRLLHATQRASNEITPEQMPRDIAEVRAPSSPPDDLQWHTMHIGADGTSAMFHGHGGEPDRVEPERRFMRAINDELMRCLRDQRSPLVFVGDVSHLNLFRDVSTYPHTCHEVIRAAPDKLTPAQLRTQAIDIVRRERQAQRRRRIERIRAAVAAGRGEASLQRIVAAAEEARVGELLINAGYHAWADLNGELRPVRAHLGGSAAAQRVAAEDFANTAAVLTLRYGGEVVVAHADEIDDRLPVAAVLRDRAGLAQ